jgi:homogentisate 1,2-dioxygenase
MWELPDLGPLGGHGLANPRDFLYPVAHIDDELSGDWEIVNKNTGRYNCLEQDHSPFDLVAWHGNVVPYKVRIYLEQTRYKTSNTICSMTLPNSPPKTQPASITPIPRSTPS